MQRQLPEQYKAKFRHERNVITVPHTKLDEEEKVIVDPKGGKTIARIIDSEGNLISEGYAICRPDEQFNRRLGRTIALGRALSVLDK